MVTLPLVPIVDVPDGQTPSVGFVVAVLVRYVAAGPWQRVSAYYQGQDNCRVRDFADDQGQVWCACELLEGTPWGYRVKVAVCPKQELETHVARWMALLAR